MPPFLTATPFVTMPVSFPASLPSSPKHHHCALCPSQLLNIGTHQNVEPLHSIRTQNRTFCACSRLDSLLDGLAVTRGEGTKDARENESNKLLNPKLEGVISSFSSCAQCSGGLLKVGEALPALFSQSQLSQDAGMPPSHYEFPGYACQEAEHSYDRSCATSVPTCPTRTMTRSD